MRRDGVEQGVDGIGVGGLDAGIGLKAKPRRVVLVDVVIDARGLDLFMIVAGMRDALAVRAPVTIIGNHGRTAANIEGATEHCQRGSAGVAIKRKHFLIERNLLRRGGIEDVTGSVLKT